MCTVAWHYLSLPCTPAFGTKVFIYSKLWQRCSGWWLVAWTEPGHYLNQRCFIVDCHPKKKTSAKLENHTSLHWRKFCQKMYPVTAPAILSREFQCFKMPFHIFSMQSDMFSFLLSSIINRVYLTHWGRAMHICVRNLTIISSDNGLSPGRRQSIAWAGIMLIVPTRIKFQWDFNRNPYILIRKIHLKMSSVYGRPYCSDLSVLSQRGNI